MENKNNNKQKTSNKVKIKTHSSEIINFSKNYSEGLKLIKTQPLKSIEYINIAIQYTNENKNNKKKCLQTRSLCYQIIGKIDESLNDANEALSYQTNDAYSILLKAEALYYKGEFEWALMYYHQGQRIRGNMKRFKIGINKCIKEIESTLLIYSKNLNINNELDFENLFSMHSGDNIRSLKSLTNRENNNISDTNVKEKSFDMKLLGELYKDYSYLNEINSKNNFIQEKFDIKLKDLCKNGLDYYNSRLEFFRQQN